METARMKSWFDIITVKKMVNFTEDKIKESTIWYQIFDKSLLEFIKESWHVSLKNWLNTKIEYALLFSVLYILVQCLKIDFILT